MSRVSAGLTAPMEESNDFRCFGHVWRTSRTDMAAGDCAKSSTKIYLCAARDCGLWTFLRNGMRGMHNGGSVDERGIINGGPASVGCVSVGVGVDSADVGY